MTTADIQSEHLWKIHVMDPYTGSTTPQGLLFLVGFFQSELSITDVVQSEQTMVTEKKSVQVTKICMENESKHTHMNTQKYCFRSWLLL